MTPTASAVLRAVCAVLGGIAGALAVGVLLVVAGTRVPALDGLAESVLVLVGIPVLVYVMVTVLLARRAQVPPVTGLLVGVAGLAVLYPLGGYVLMLTACGIAPNGGC